ncbi:MULTISPECIES: glycosyltransferase family protein [Ureibacillus]|uniref:Spore maturation protein CgeB n=1 Tax=Ureibacillus thermosphaericus TaxID=51173 RepID=A0A840PQM3_URETH|nr:glycosyltransferase [Ureibacillus thermosphaericus]MBB5148313.1 spore maturation protein CgeB [Ureibacillus thermosphaericus]NKZ31538.1 glycosyltransferase [Ureibacillus thermosphaericus]
MQKKLKILILIRQFTKNFPKHKHKFETIKAIEKFADVRYWYRDGNIHDILKQLDFKPDFIFHYDIGWGYVLAPRITGLHEINIPKGCYVIDTHYSPAERRKYFEQNKIDLIFSATKSSFLKTHAKYKDKFRWLPFSIDPTIFKDWQLEKDIDFLLIGQLYDRTKKTGYQSMTPKGKYPFREAVLEKLRGEKGFVFHPHPGHNASSNALVNEKYAKELNRAKIFFTCGSRLQYPVLKYFEAPACKTLLLAEPVPDILELGFKDGENFVACNQSNFYEKAMYYLKNEKERKRITENGYQFIHTKHTNDVRAKEFVQEVQKFLDKL